MQRAWKQAGRDPKDVDFIEAHATGDACCQRPCRLPNISFSGTAAGDPTEANWVGETFQRDSELLIGSVKGNIG